MKIAWTKEAPFSKLFICKMMKGHRFRQILSCWSWVLVFGDQYDKICHGMSEEERIRKNEANGLWSVDSFCDLLEQTEVNGKVKYFFTCQMSYR